MMGAGVHHRTMVMSWGLSLFLALFLVRRPHLGSPMQGQMSWDLSGKNHMFPEGTLTSLHGALFPSRKKIDLGPKVDDMIFKERN